MENTEPTPSENYLEILIRNIGVFGALCYCLGFAVTTLHYAKYNLVAMDFLSPQYIVCGVPLMMIIISGAWTFKLMGPLFSFKDFSTPSKKLKHISIVFLTLLIMIAASGIILSFVFIWFFGSSLTRIECVFLCINVLSLIALLTVLMPILPKDLFTDIKSIKTDNWHRILINQLGWLTFFPCFIYGYTTIVYNRIPASFGGGKARSISFIFKDTKTLNPMFYSRMDSNKISASYLLAKETEKDYYILVTDTPIQVIDLPKESLAASIITAN